MAIQGIVYSAATGRVRRVVDPQANVPNVLAFLAQLGAGPGEAPLVYTKKGGGADNAYSWQAAVNAHTGKNVQPGVDANDTFAVVDVNGNIVSIKYGADPACGDFEPNCTLVQSTTMLVGGTYIGGIYTPPPSITVSPVPAPATLGGTVQFTVTLVSTSGIPVWAVNGIAGGNATIGTISASGLYTAPAVNPGGKVVVSASLNSLVARSLVQFP